MEAHAQGRSQRCGRALRLAGAVAGLALLATSCMNVSVGPVNIGAPVIVSRVDCIGGGTQRGDLMPVASFEGQAKLTVMGAGGTSQQTQGGYVVTETRSASARSELDDVGAKIWQAWSRAGGRAENVTYVDDIRARAWLQNYVFLMVGGVQVAVQGEVTRSKDVRR